MKTALNIVSCIILLIFLNACATKRYSVINKNIGASLQQSFFDQQFTGLLIYDPQSRDTLFDIHSEKYFTPASNTKIFTLYAALKLLPQNIPSFKYLHQKDTLYIQGTGDPTQLHPYFKDSTLIRFLKGFSTIALNLNNYEDEKYGPGWAWEDYDGYYSPERSALPLYGNILHVYKSDSLQITPSFFSDSLVPIKFERNRKEDGNVFFFDPDRKDTLEIPFRTSHNLTKKLLAAALKKEISLVDKIPAHKTITVPGIAADSVYKRMMQESDNFLAEQLLIMASSTLSDTLSGQRASEYILNNHLSDLKQPPRWVDGSGLSRYNLFSPESLVHVLTKLYREVPRERLFSLFPAGGASGTLEDWFPGNSDPYVYAKTGTLGNNYCLSGYLLTKSGKTLIFSFMNNHFRQPTSQVKRQMQRVLEYVRDSY